MIFDIFENTLTVFIQFYIFIDLNFYRNEIWIMFMYFI